MTVVFLWVKIVPFLRVACSFRSRRCYFFSCCSSCRLHLVVYLDHKPQNDRTEMSYFASGVTLHYFFHGVKPRKSIANFQRLDQFRKGTLMQLHY